VLSGRAGSLVFAAGAGETSPLFSGDTGPGARPRRSRVVGAFDGAPVACGGWLAAGPSADSAAGDDDVEDFGCFWFFFVFFIAS
jgi:hypothetical protein